MSDRELLELAAKAAGIEVLRARLHDPLFKDMLINKSFRNETQVSGPWNPLTDDGDALRLAVTVRLFHEDDFMFELMDATSAKRDPYSATRRAIVMAAAEIGRSMP